MTLCNPPSRAWFLRPWLWKSLAVGVLLVVLTLAIFVEYLSHLAVKIPHERRDSVVTAASLSPDVQDVSTETADGLRVAAWWWPVSNEQGAPVILVHGLGGSRADMWRAIKLVHGLGRNALAIDLRGHGQSAPSLTSFGYREAGDVEAWTDWLKAREGPSSRPVLWGTSLGAVTCLLAAEENPQVGGVIADAPFDTLRHTLIRHAAIYYPWMPSQIVSLVGWRVGAENRLPFDEVDCVNAARHIHVPVLIIAGELDHRMPPEDVRRIYDAANEPKAWFVVEKAGHSWRPFHPDFCAAVTAYLQQSASATTSSAALPKPPQLR